VVGGNFRRSFGASDNAFVTALPVVLGALILSALVWPERRVLLHVVAALMVAVLVGSALVARETAFMATLGIAYAAAWLYLYYRLVRA
jgi:hypothetical protein